MVKEIKTDKDFEETMKNPLVVVDFWASWCMPCLSMAPVFEELSKKFNKITFAKLNVDENNGLARKFSINAIPAFILFKKGKAVDKITGALPKEEFEKKFKDFIK